MDAIKEITRFQTDRDLDKKDYDALNEHASIVEELFESVGFDIPKENRAKLKEAWGLFVQDTANTNEIATINTFSPEGIFPENEKVDAYCDIVVFAVGAIMKLGYDPELALLEVAKEINSRKGEMVHGKFEKDLSEEAKANWYKADFTNCKRS